MFQLLQPRVIDAIGDPLHIRRPFDQTRLFQDRDVLGNRRRCQRQHVSQVPEVALAVIDQVPQQLDARGMRERLAHACQVVGIDFRSARTRSRRRAAGL